MGRLWIAAESGPRNFAIKVSQAEFADSMTKPKLRVREPPHLTVTPEEAPSLKSVLGAGLWLAKETRPDLSVQVSQGQQLFPSPTLRGREQWPTLHAEQNNTRCESDL